MRLKRKTDEEQKDFLTLVPVGQERLGAPSPLHHDHPWIDSQQQKLVGPTNPETMTFHQHQVFLSPNLIALHDKPGAPHGGLCALACLESKHGSGMLRIQVSVQILIPLIFYSSQFILLIFIHACICSRPVFVVTV